MEQNKPPTPESALEKKVFDEIYLNYSQSMVLSTCESISFSLLLVILFKPFYIEVSRISISSVDDETV